MDLKFYIGKNNGVHFEANVYHLGIGIGENTVALFIKCYEVTEEGGTPVIGEFRKPYERKLIASNETFVNPQTGAYVPADTAGAMGEWDFFWHIAQNVPIKVFEFITATLVKNRNRLMPDGLLAE